MSGSNGRRIDSVKVQAKADPVVNAVRAAMIELGIHANLDAIEHHIRHKQKVAGIRWDYLRECCRLQRLSACDWLKIHQNKDAEKPPIVPPAIAERFATPKPVTDNANGVYANVAPKPPAEPSKPVESVSPTVGEAEEEDAEPKRIRGRLIFSQKVKVRDYLDSQRDLIARSNWNVNQVIADFNRREPDIYLSPDVVRKLCRLIGVKLAPLPAEPKPPKPKPEAVTLASLSAKLEEAFNRIEFLESELGVR